MALQQAEKESEASGKVLPRAARKCFKWLLCPLQDDPTTIKPSIEPFPLNTTSGNAHGELERACRENESPYLLWDQLRPRRPLRGMNRS